jgi:hypothetical protein
MGGERKTTIERIQLNRQGTSLGIIKMIENQPKDR